MAVYVWRDPGQSLRALTPSPWPVYLDRAILILLPASWCFLVVRVIHGESLVGDRQFWVTRPYEWKKLLAAKIVFVAAFICLPMFVAQEILLTRAGFGAFGHFTGLLEMQIGFAVFVFLAPAALATVTRGMGWTLLAALGAIAAVVGIATLANVIPSASASAATDASGDLQGIAILGGAAVVIVWQFARRKTWQSRGILMGVAVLVAGIEAATPYAAVMARKYPPVVPGQEAPVMLSIVRAPRLSEKGAEKSEDIERFSAWQSDTALTLPLQVSSIAKNSVVAVDAMRTEIDAPGVHWDSGWQNLYKYLWPEEDSANIVVTVKKNVYNKLRMESSKLHLTLAVTEFQESDPRDVTMQDGKFPIPGVGVCRIYAPYFYSKLLCDAALITPNFISRTGPLRKNCSANARDDESHAAKEGRSFRWEAYSSMASPGVDPVEHFDAYFEVFEAGREVARSDEGRLCAGTALHVSTPIEAGHSRVDLKMDDVRLVDYAEAREIMIQVAPPPATK